MLAQFAVSPTTVPIGLRVVRVKPNRIRESFYGQFVLPVVEIIHPSEIRQTTGGMVRRIVGVTGEEYRHHDNDRANRS